MTSRGPSSAHDASVSPLPPLLPLLLSLAVTGSVASPARADADPVPEPDLALTTRALVFTGGAFGGGATLGFSGIVDGSFDVDLDSSPLFGLRYEAVFYRYLGLGGQLGFTFVRADGENRRNLMLDVALTPRVRYPIVIDSRFLVEPYIVVPIGFLLGVWNDSIDPGTSGLDRTNPGLVVGALAGVTFLTRSHIGAMLEFGWVHRVLYDEDSAGTRYTLTSNQATLHVGAVYAF